MGVLRVLWIMASTLGMWPLRADTKTSLWIIHYKYRKSLGYILWHCTFYMLLYYKLITTLCYNIETTLVAEDDVNTSSRTQHRTRGWSPQQLCTRWSFLRLLRFLGQSLHWKRLSTPDVRWSGEQLSASSDQWTFLVDGTLHGEWADEGFWFSRGRLQATIQNTQSNNIYYSLCIRQILGHSVKHFNFD